MKMNPGEMPAAGTPASTKKPKDSFREEASTSHSKTVEKMTGIVFEKQVEDLKKWGEQVEKDIVDLEQEIEEFCAEEAAQQGAQC
jgi:hypothetical protein